MTLKKQYRNQQSKAAKRKKGMVYFEHRILSTLFCVYQLQHTLHLIQEEYMNTKQVIFFLRNKDQVQVIKLCLVKNSYSLK